MVTFADVLNEWAQIGVFAYVIPALLIFAIIFGILQKSKILGAKRGIDAIIAMAAALLSLQMDFISSFFTELFPRFGVGLAVFLVMIIFVGLFMKERKEGEGNKAFYIIAFIIVFAVLLWTFGNWQTWGGFGLGSFLEDNFWLVFLFVCVIAAVGIIIAAGGGEDK